MRCPTLLDLPQPPRSKKRWPWMEESPQLADVMPGGDPWPKISIVTPSYNQGRFIEETIRSVLLQGYPNLEYIVIDGGSTDNSAEIIKKYEKWLAYWISEPDRGQSHAINKGFEKATGLIYTWLNSDDTYMSSGIETAVKFLLEHPDVSMVYGDCNIINESSEVVDKIIGHQFDLKNTLIHVRHGIPQPTVFLRREVLGKVGPLDTNLHMAMDLDLWIRISLSFKMRYIPELLANFRRCAGTKTVSFGYKFEQDHLYILDKIFSNQSLPIEMRALKRRAYSWAYLRIGLVQRSLKQRAQAIKYMMKSLRLHPWPLIATLAMYPVHRVNKLTTILRSK